ncbi:hypothetical protein [Nocardia terpenica]|uniref:hypothetical protein n=1 Tax=Nocardia terpenica TaxID=455432 RepID=UPI000A8F630A|nr:hypothetical protein [Nocardia terpenica]
MPEGPEDPAPRLAELVSRRLDSDPSVTPEVARAVLEALGAGPDGTFSDPGYTGIFLRAIRVRGFRGIGREAVLTLNPGPAPRASSTARATSGVTDGSESRRRETSSASLGAGSSGPSGNATPLRSTTVPNATASTANACLPHKIRTNRPGWGRWGVASES